jgi:hypothetical protein
VQGVKCNNLHFALSVLDFTLIIRYLRFFLGSRPQIFLIGF